MNQDIVQPESLPTLQRAWQLYEFRRYALALEETYKFLARYPESANAYCLIALIHGQEKRKAKAIKAAREAIRLSPDWCYPHYVYALIQSWFEGYDEAKKGLAAALRIQPNDPDYYSLLAYIHYVQGHLQTSLAAAEAGLERDAEHVGCHHRRGAALFSLKSINEAEKEFRIALQINPEHAPSQGYLGHFAVERGNFAEALPLLRHALRNNPDWELAQTAWKEALRGKYPSYGVVARLKQALFKNYGLPFFFLYVFNLGLFVLLTFQRRGSFTADIVLNSLGSLIFTAIAYTFVLLVLSIYLALISRFLLVYDRELRSAYDWRKTLLNWKEILREFWSYVLYLLFFATCIIAVVIYVMRYG